ncbi:dTDP-4-dehydrorhamnose reductase [Aliiglaciecola lipolytica]|uniref:dTDP-4-dehydrorhamnose reductase n=1 Tax=Aliiglaciecola lipolytica E3 TaxID=1127673 RepID=K6YPY5_9ALTE|nr:dTDP-4-dehydrorhamnose reductase [Aliiglaciecola lipolytica]GAC13370.1 dTDP-4-dehydrorhamnose reductase [Aliiglaciecola lipolytica E3]
MTIIVIGKSGQLAQELKLLDNSVLCLGRRDIDITSAENVNSVLSKHNVTGIINASAYTAVDKAESEQEQAFSINATGVSNLAQYASLKNVPLMHVSTDYVFSGDKGSPYKTDDVKAPIGVYGASKLAGEQAIEQYAPKQGCIIRTSWVYSEFGHNFVKTMLRMMAEKPQLSIIDDQIGSPTSASALAKACMYAAINKVTGPHHFTDAGVCSWYDFALEIQEYGIAFGLLDKSIEIKPIPTSAYATAAKRPSYSVLDKATLQTAFDGLQPKHWREELRTVIQQLAAQKTTNRYQT